MHYAFEVDQRSVRTQKLSILSFSLSFQILKSNIGTRCPKVSLKPRVFCRDERVLACRSRIPTQNWLDWKPFFTFFGLISVVSRQLKICDAAKAMACLPNHRGSDKAILTAARNLWKGRKTLEYSATIFWRVGVTPPMPIYPHTYILRVFDIGRLLLFGACKMHGWKFTR